MAESALLEAIKAIPDPDAAPTNMVQDIASSLAPMSTEAATRAQGGRLVVTPNAPVLSKEARFQSENVEATPGEIGPAAPIRTAADTQTVEGALGFVPLSARVQMGRRKDFMDQYEYLNQRFPGKVRISKDGHDFIVKLPDSETGGEKDVLVNDRSINLGDVAELAGKAPEMAAGVIAAALARKIPGLSQLGPKAKFARDVTSASVGMEGAKALQTMETRAEEGQPIRAGEAISSAAKDIPVDIALGYLTGGAFKLVNEAYKFVQAPFSFSRGPAQTEGLAAAARVDKALGTKLLYSPADTSGSPVMAMGQKMVESLPSGAAPAKARLAEIQASKDATFRAITAGAKSDEEVGRTLVEELQGIRNVTEGQIGAMAGTVERSGTQALKTASQAAAGTPTGPGSGFSPIAKGKELRGGLAALHEKDMTVKNQLYAEAYAEPGALERNFSTKPIENKLVELRKDLPTRHVEKESVKYDQYGGTMAETSTKAEPVSEFIHPEVKRFLSARLDPEMKVSELVNMRSMLYDEIAQGDAVQGIPTRHLKSLANSMTEAIDQGVNALPSGNFKTKLAAANSFYKKNVLRWEEPGFYDLFRKSNQGAGYVSDEAVLGRLRERPSQFIETLKRVQGTPAEGALKGSVVDDLLNRSTAGLGSDTIDGKAFLKAFDELRLGDNKDIANAVFGKNLDKLVSAARRMAIGQGQITKEQARELLASDAPSLALVNGMFAATEKAQELYKNQLIKDYTVGKLDLNTVNAEQALNGFLNTGTTSDIKWLVNVAAGNPDLAEQLPRKALEQILRKAGPDINDKTLKAVINETGMAEKYEALLGPRRMELLKDLSLALAPYRITKEYGAGTGVFAKGSATGKLMRAIVSVIFLNPKGGKKEIEELVGYKMIALALTNPTVESWFRMTPEYMFKDLGKAVVVSEPFLKALGEDVSNNAEKAGIVNQIRRMFGFNQPAGKAPAKKTDAQIRMDEFLKSGQLP